MHLTWLDNNSWLIEMGGQRVLLDPWLVGTLTFGNQAWLFQGKRPTTRPMPTDVDFILLSQGLEDHAHIPTLETLDRDLPVVCSPNAEKVVTSLGYTQITPLAHGEALTWGDRLTIKALPGAPIGPLLKENAYLLSDRDTGARLYYEPHGFPDASLQQEPPVDVAITPVVDLSLPVLGPIIRGKEGGLQLATWLQPRVLLPTAAGGEVVYEGVLASLLQTSGGPEAMQQTLAEAGLPTQVLTPQPGDRLTFTPVSAA